MSTIYKAVLNLDTSNNSNNFKVSQIMNLLAQTLPRPPTQWARRLTLSQDTPRNGKIKGTKPVELIPLLSYTGNLLNI